MNVIRLVCLTLLLGAAGCGTRTVKTESNFALFDGISLAGWRVTGGGATYHVDDGAIVGEAGPGPNTFLRTERRFADFDLDLEFRWDLPCNSGIQFRSHQRDGDGVVYGYQCEIDPSDRAWTGGIYDESRRGWLASLEERPAARAAVSLGDWNHLRVLAVGPRLRTWLNGVPCADLIDDTDRDGFIALQVHGGAAGRIRWRAIRIREIPG